MNKRYLHHLWTYVRRVKVWHLLAALLLCLVIHLFALRANNLTMVRLRNAVYAADKSGNAVEQSLQSLRNYVQSHMNTNLQDGATGVYPPIQLKYTYERLQQAEKQRVAGANAALYPAAQAFCQQQNSTDFSGRNRIPCIENYVSQNGAKARTIPDSLYKFSFISPSWSPDLAGWTRLLSILLSILAVARIAVVVWVKKFLK